MQKNLITDVLRSDGEYRQLLETVKNLGGAKPLPMLLTGMCQGVTETFCAAFAADMAAEKRTPILLLCPDEKDATRLCYVLRSFGVSAAFYPQRDLNLYNITASHDFEHQRIGVLYGLANGSLDVVLTTPDAAVSYTVPAAVLKKNVIHVDTDSHLSTTDLAAQLIAAGYVRTEMADGVGQFAIRGGIIDIYPAEASYLEPNGSAPEIQGTLPLRIELFGDEIDRMVLFTPDTQRTITMVSLADIPPVREILPDADARMRLERALQAQLRLAPTDEAKTTVAHELQSLQADTDSEILFIDKYVSLVYPDHATLLDYFTSNAVVLMHGTTAVGERIKAAEWRMNQTVEELVTGGTLSGKYAEFNIPTASLVAWLAAHPVLHLDAMAHGGTKLSGLFSFSTRHTVSYAENFELLCDDLRHLIADRNRILIQAETAAAATSLQKMLADAEFNARVIPQNYDFAQLDEGGIGILSHGYCAGFEMPARRAAVLSVIPEGHSGSLTVSDKRRIAKKRKNTQTIMSYADLSVGDYVVHEAYGIGIYTGIQHLTTDGVTRDYIGVQYAGSDKLYLPVEKLDRLAKYIGAKAEDGTVKLSHFGGGSWEKVKSRTKAAVKAMAKELIALYAERMKKPGFAFPADDAAQVEFEDAFPYEETDSQLNAAEDIKADMERPVPMDRLLCGDVGYGKTEVALRAAYKAVLAGKQVAVLVPTTILALQHLGTFTSRMRPFAVEVDMVSRFKTAKEQERTLRRVKRGEVDVLIGTHRMIGKDIAFKDLGLLIVDEEQRFGVAQKEKIKQLAPNVDVLTLTATPIPRTLNMAMSGIRDISLLEEPPTDRQAVQTYVLEDDDLIIYDAIRRELRRGGQVFYLHNNIGDIRELAGRIAKAVPEARITVAHGQMDKEELEDIWGEMIRGDIDILVCTTIIETGVDVPNANTLIVSGAHRLGLSQLHQLRGRVGRSSRRAYAYFTYPPNKSLTEVAEKRLEAVRDYAEFGAGFKIALRDMEIRGVGNLLGAEQHGQMDAVGYDLYMKLLETAVLEEQGQAKAELPDCTITLNCDAYLPDSYIPNEGQRIAMYKKIALITDESDQDDVADEMLDRYGEFPRQADNLLQISLIRATATKCGISVIKQEENAYIITPLSFDPDVWMGVCDVCGGRLTAVMSTDPYLTFKLRKDDDGLRLLLKMLQKCAALTEKKEKESESQDEEKQED